MTRKEECKTCIKTLTSQLKSQVQSIVPDYINDWKDIIATAQDAIRYIEEIKSIEKGKV